jgi:hypothetical protein
MSTYGCDLAHDPRMMLDKYMPRHTKDLIGAKKQIFELKTWLARYDTNAIEHHKKKPKTPKKSRKNKQVDTGMSDEDMAGEPKMRKKDPNQCSCAVLTGNHGIGKTSLIRAVLSDYDIKYVNLSKVDTGKSIDNTIRELLTASNIYKTIDKIAHKKLAIVVDDVQSISTTIEKNIASGLVKMNSDLWECPVIFVGSNKHKKIISLLKKDCYNIALYDPDRNDMVSLLERIGLGEGMCMENESIVYRIVDHCQNDYRRLILTMGELKRLYKTKPIQNRDFDNYVNYISLKDMDNTIYESIGHIFSNYTGIQGILKIFDHDKTNMPLMVHQNHFMASANYISDKTKLLDLAQSITQSMTYGDVIDGYIYAEQNWSLQETNGFYTCVYPSFKMSQSVDTTRMARDIAQPFQFKSQYPKDLNKTSTRCINYKNIKIANNSFDNMEIEDYMMIIKLISSLLEDGRVAECKQLIDQYKLSASSLTYLLKIEKIHGARKDISKIIGKELKVIASAHDESQCVADTGNTGDNEEYDEPQ